MDPARRPIRIGARLVAARGFLLSIKRFCHSRQLRAIVVDGDEAGGCLLDSGDGNLGRAILVEQAVRLLVCIAELRITESREEPQIAYDREKTLVLNGKILWRHARGVSPRPF